ncbi:MAG: hypothetical protein LZF60_80500 [Nitrospira sp.]|nr:MAG: hypothetical protein LZF60_80500 [Nitrospira sp.]
MREENCRLKSVSDARKSEGREVSEPTSCRCRNSDHTRDQSAQPNDEHKRHVEEELELIHRDRLQ